MSSRQARRRAREFALQGIYQWLLSANPLSQIEEHLSNAAGFEKADREMFIMLFRGSVSNVEALRAEFRGFIDRPLEELSPVEHSVLLLATQELMHCLEVPYRVVINEAIELTKSYGGTDGHRFVNGVVDKLAGRLRSIEVQAAGRKG